MKLLWLLILLPSLSSAQFLAGRFFFSPYGSYRTISPTKANDLIDEDSSRIEVQSWFSEKLKHFKDGRGLGIGLGYGFTHHFLLFLSFDSTKYKSYNRSTIIDYIESESQNATIESNLNYSITAKTLLANIALYLLNTPRLGLFFTAGAGLIFDSSFDKHLYFPATLEDGSMAVLLDEHIVYKQKKPAFAGQVSCGIDIALGILTSILLEGGWRYAVVSEMQNESSSQTLVNNNNDPVEFNFSGFFASAHLRFVF